MLILVVIYNSILTFFAKTENAYIPVNLKFHSLCNRVNSYKVFQEKTLNTLGLLPITIFVFLIYICEFFGVFLTWSYKHVGTSFM